MLAQMVRLHLLSIPPTIRIPAKPHALLDSSLSPLSRVALGVAEEISSDQQS